MLVQKSFLKQLLGNSWFKKVFWSKSSGVVVSKKFLGAFYRTESSSKNKLQNITIKMHSFLFFI